MQQQRDIVLQKSGLYLQLAKLKGYQVIEYDPRQRTHALFSVNCLLSCLLKSRNINEQVCNECGSKLELYTDKIMTIFNTKVRIDLMNRKYCSLQTEVKSWEQVPETRIEQMSHLQYMRALKMAEGDTVMRQCINNYYNYQLMPIPRVRSYWQEYRYGEQDGQECMSVCRYNKQELMVVIGTDRWHKIEMQAGYNECIRECEYFGNYMGMVCTKQGVATLLIYELSHGVCSADYSIIIGKYPVEQRQSIIFNITFEYECLRIAMTDRVACTCKMVEVANVMAAVPDIQLVHTWQYPKMTQQSLDHYNWHINSSKPGSTANMKEYKIKHICTTQQHICMIEQDGSTYTIANTDNIVNIHGQVHARSKSSTYFYANSQDSTSFIKLIKYQHNTHKLTSETLHPANCISQQIQPTHQLQSIQSQFNLDAIVYSKPAIDGCILTRHIQTGNQIHHVRTCVCI